MRKNNDEDTLYSWENEAIYDKKKLNKLFKLKYMF